MTQLEILPQPPEQERGVQGQRDEDAQDRDPEGQDGADRERGAPVEGEHAEAGGRPREPAVHLALPDRDAARAGRRAHRFFPAPSGSRPFFS